MESFIFFMEFFVLFMDVLAPFVCGIVLEAFFEAIDLGEEIIYRSSLHRCTLTPFMDLQGSHAFQAAYCRSF